MVANGAGSGERALDRGAVWHARAPSEANRSFPKNLIRDSLARRRRSAIPMALVSSTDDARSNVDLQNSSGWTVSEGAC